jgi:hypothetical protein
LLTCTPQKDAGDRVVARVEIADAARPEAEAVAIAPDAAQPPAEQDAARVPTDDDREQEYAEKMATEGKRGCAGQTRLIDPKGEVVRCYPYRCRAGRCLDRCRSNDDCVPSAKPGESLYVKGWPILCGGHVPPAQGKTAECLPLSPEDVHPRR